MASGVTAEERDVRLRKEPMKPNPARRKKQVVGEMGVQCAAALKGRRLPKMSVAHATRSRCSSSCD
eukprot:920722-Prymnesium_polylepis.1